LRVSPRLGEQLRVLRWGAGLSQRALAKAAGLGSGTIALVERRDDDERFQLSTLVALADALGCDVEITLQERSNDDNE